MKIKKNLIFTACLFLFVLQTSAQTLFTYGSHPVSKNEFLQAYNKNSDTAGNKQQKLKEYLNLYINFRLKLQAAYDEKANTNAELKGETDNFRTQLTDNFINQQADVSKLLHEAFIRSQKDILLQQVFIPFQNNDTAIAFTEITKAYKALKSGKNFNEVSEVFSTDSATKASKGIVGYVTAFTLAYSIENIVYGLPQGAFSEIYKGKTGYHIFKNISERPALGRRKIQQLIFATPAFFTSDQIIQTKKTADSVYNLLQKGSVFERFLPAYGKSYQTFDPSASIEIKIGEYNSDFENEVFKLEKAGDFSKPFKTAYGWNIIKLLEVDLPAKDENDVVYSAYLQTQIQADGRLDIAKDNLVQKWLTEMRYQPQGFNKKDLWKYTGSALNTDSLPLKFNTIKPNTILFQFKKQKYTVEDWITYLKSERPVQSENVYNEQLHNFLTVEGKQYYRTHIEDFDPAMADQLKEFNDANMLFYVMDKHVWTKAANDSVGLKNFYEQNRNNYKWNRSVSALVISGSEKTTVNEVAEKIKSNPTDWRKIVSAYGNAVFSDSSRFETDQLPVKTQIEMEKDFQTVPEQNEAKDAYIFVHIVEIFPNIENRSFEEARGLLINDYQEKLESNWIKELKENYPVKINEGVFSNIDK